MFAPSKFLDNKCRNLDLKISSVGEFADVAWLAFYHEQRKPKNETKPAKNCRKLRKETAKDFWWDHKKIAESSLGQLRQEAEPELETAGFGSPWMMIGFSPYPIISNFIHLGQGFF